MRRTLTDWGDADGVDDDVDGLDDGGVGLERFCAEEFFESLEPAGPGSLMAELGVDWLVLEFEYGFGEFGRGNVGQGGDEAGGPGLST